MITITIEEWLSHPFVLLLVGALISSYLIPLFTRRWQDHETELNLKVGLVEKISDAVTRMVMAIQFAEVGATSQKQEEFDAAYRDWEIERASIGSHLQAYFPKTDIGSNWKHYSELVSDFYALTGIFDEKGRNEQLKKIHKSLGTVSIMWEALAKREEYKNARGEKRRQYFDNWFELKEQILSQKDNLVQDIIRSRISAFSKGFVPLSNN